MMDAPAWSISGTRIEQQTLQMGGWAVSPWPTDGQPRVLVNGRPVNSTDWQRRPDIDRLFWFVPEDRRYGFKARIATDDIAGDHDDVEIGASWAKKDGRVYNLPSFFLRRTGADCLALPDEARRMRVHGGRDESAFRMIGCTTAGQLDAALRREFNRPLNSFARILDWGCGCGRLTRYLEATKAAITGVDIDADNVAWCAENLLFARFQHIGPDPPLPLEAGSIDLIIGISIFTHLSDQDQFSWLRELRRVVSRGGVVAVTVSGNSAVARSGVGAALAKRWWNAGFLDVGRNTDLDGMVVSSDRYRNVFHSPRYIAERWPSTGFKVLSISPATIGGHQDLVLLQPV